MKKKVNSKNNIPKFSVGGQTLTGAATGAGVGASIGSIIPGPGTAIGAGVGALVGGIGGYMSGKADEEAMESQKNSLKFNQVRNDFNLNYKPQFSSGYYAMATGGVMPGTNAMIDNNEVVQTNGPINQLAQANGGGQLNQTSANTAVVNGNNPNQTDGVQAQIEPGSRIFSDKIKSISGKTYAEIAEKISKGKSRYEKILEQDDVSSLQKKTANKMIEKIESELDQLFQEQESIKSNSSNIQPTMNMGGEVPKYYIGGVTNPYEPEPDVYEPDVENTLSKYRMQQKYPNYTNYSDMVYGKEPVGQTSATNPNPPMVPNYTGIMPNTAMVPNNFQSVVPLAVNKTAPVNTDYSVGPAGPTSTMPNQPGTPASRPGYKRDLYGNEYKVNALGLSDWQTEKGLYNTMGALAPAVSIGRGIFEKVDLLDPNAYNNTSRITAPKMDVEPQVAEVRNASIANRRALGSMGAQAFLTGMNSVNANSDRSIAGIYANKHNIDAENQMKADMYNVEASKGDAENRLRIEMINRAAKGAKDQMLTTGLSQLSEMGQRLRSQESYNRSMQSVNSNYRYSPETGTWNVYNSSEKGNVAKEEEKKSSTTNQTLSANDINSSKKSLLSNANGLSNSYMDKNRVSGFTANVKGKDTDKFSKVWTINNMGGSKYDDYLNERLNKAGVTKSQRATMTWGQIKKYLD